MLKLALQSDSRYEACTYNCLVTQRELRVVREKAISEVKANQGGPLYSYLNYTLDCEESYSRIIISDVKAMAKPWKETTICKDYSSIVNVAGIVDYLYR